MEPNGTISRPKGFALGQRGNVNWGARSQESRGRIKTWPLGVASWGQTLKGLHRGCMQTSPPHGPMGPRLFRIKDDLSFHVCDWANMLLESSPPCRGEDHKEGLCEELIPPEVLPQEPSWSVPLSLLHSTEGTCWFSFLPLLPFTKVEETLLL